MTTLETSPYVMLENASASPVSSFPNCFDGLNKPNQSGEVKLSEVFDRNKSNFPEFFLKENLTKPTDAVKGVEDNGKAKLDTVNITDLATNKPNNVYEVDGVTYKTDDNGNPYMVDGKLAPNNTYELNGSVYTTDGMGRIIRCEAKPQHSPENPRDIAAQLEAGGNDRKENDQGGHIIGRDLNGDGGGGNMVAMEARINQSDYKRMENDIKNALDEGKDVTTKTDIHYEGDSERPDKLTVTVEIDGKKTVYIFDNNIDGSLKDDVIEAGKDAVQSELDDTGGNISSIKEEYDADGKLETTTVNITYMDDEGFTHRTKVVIDNKLGGENV